MNLAFLELFIEACGGRTAMESLTTAQVAETIIKPLTASTQLSLCDTLVTYNRTDAVQIADIFISHAWSYSFLDMIDAIHEYAIENNKKPSDLYVWLDLVSNPQHGAEERPFSWWKTTFINAIRDIKEVVLVLQPWDDPIPLTRAWCIFEIFACHLTEGQLNVTMSRNESKRMLDALAEDKAEGYNKMLEQVSCEKSQSTIPEDRTRIFDAINDLGASVQDLDRMVFDEFTKSIVNTFKRHLEFSEDHGDKGDIIRHQLSLVQVYFHLSRYQEAEELCLEAIKRSEVAFGSKDGQTVDARMLLMNLHTHFKPTEEALEMAKQVTADQTRIHGSDHVKAVESRHLTACLQYRLGNIELSLFEYQEVLDHATRVLGPGHHITMDARNNISVIYSVLGRHQDCLEELQRLYEIKRRVCGDTHVTTLRTLENLSTSYWHMDNLEMAESTARECYAERKIIFGERHLETLSVLVNLAGLCRDNGEYEEAEKFFFEIVKGMSATQGPGHPQTLDAMNFLGIQYGLNGKWNEALQVLNGSLQRKYELFGEKHGSTLGTMAQKLQALVNLGSFDEASTLVKTLEATTTEMKHVKVHIVAGLLSYYTATGQYSKITSLSDDIELVQGTFAPNSAKSARFQQGVGLAYIEMGLYQKAKEILVPTFDIISATKKFDHPLALFSAATKVKLDIVLGNYIEAENLCIKIIPKMVEKLGPRHPSTLSTKTTLGELQIKLHRLVNAKSLLSENHATLAQQLGLDHPLTLSCQYQLAEAHRQSGNLETAQSLHETCLGYRKTKLGESHPDTLSSQTGLACIFRDLGDLNKSLDFFDSVAKIMESQLRKEHPLVLDVYYEMGRTMHLKSLKVLEKCWDCRKRVVGDKHPDTIAVGEVLALLKQKC
ncbi:Kinesin light chain 3 [Blyttiomyces sp. JEL0837]|nr:Kinesin light chain 3 [Blyttiomyces sp. JEL0837]